MKKNVLLKKAGALLLALSMSVAAFSTAAPEGKIIAKAIVGGESSDKAVEIPANYEFTEWAEYKGGNQYYKFTIPEDGDLTLHGTFYKSGSMAISVLNHDFKEFNWVHTEGTDTVADETSIRSLSAGTYYIKVSDWYGYTKEAENKYKFKLSFKGYGVSENTVDSYENPKGYEINTTVTDSLTSTDNEDWYKFNVSKENKYVLNLTAYSNTAVTYSRIYEALIFNNDLTEKKLDISGADRTGEVYLNSGVYYLKIVGSNVKYSFSIKGASIEKTKVTKVKSPKKKKAEVTFKAVDGVNGYQIEYSTDKNFKKNVKSKTFKIEKTQDAGNNKRKITISKLKRHKRYYFRIRTYVENNNSRFYSDWSKAKMAKIK
ncbi:hypothetical protein [Butyrivibrio sp. WCD2001]|uniref:hypothetical protein n=1 Tax=Butyrivibrio sp. WCD2001 TaxID=1280681 RepID=UPI00047C61FE|nr:hypothetical protein [Butyrivibrio sp. WCD2001]